MLPNPPITVYTADRAVRPLLAFVELLAMQLHQPVQLLPLSALPPPDRHQRQQKKTELLALRGELAQVRYLLAQAETRPHDYPRYLVLLREDEQRYQQAIARLEQQLAEL
ncbi:hypothetical protein F1C16_03035 [Hymenobacter sp. NBH84]|uniref:hypothetical protein n=1 Tax=Hymenobacter sp. NBH84 TaxID=2596915 RepID=UPI0016246AA3|nr:hypothetical protein [Hymenobacter sp. NBH84]QNE38598.1 hypothetical protein F1C16_03035 [Hymenobacter sp. NBH84]